MEFKIQNQVCEVLGADGLVYQDVADLIAVGRELNPSIEEVRARALGRLVAWFCGVQLVCSCWSLREGVSAALLHSPSTAHHLPAPQNDRANATPLNTSQPPKPHHCFEKKPRQFDAACFTGRYVTGDIDDAYLAALEASGRGANRRSGVPAANKAAAAAAEAAAAAGAELTGAGAGAAAA